MQKITIVSLGPGPRAQLTLGALERMRKARRLILRTGETDAARYLKEQGVAYQTLDHLHEACEDFDAFIEAAVQTIAKAAARASVTYAVLDALSDETAAALLERYPDQATFCGGAGIALPLLHAAGARLPVRVASATGLTVPATQDGLLVVEMNTRMLAGECKLKLASWYGDDAEALFFPPAEKEQRSFLRVPLCEIDRQARYDHTTAVYLAPAPLETLQRFDLWDLTRIMRRLRQPGGCPWDAAQTHRTLSRYLIEEAYEVSDAVAQEDWDHVADELGDVLLQVMFQSDIGEQYGTFELSDVTTAICRKMMERHPRLFTDGAGDRDANTDATWEMLKQRQRSQTTAAAVLQDVSEGLPGLLRAEKILRKMEGLGIDASPLYADEPARELLVSVTRMRQNGLCAEEEIQNLLSRMIRQVENAEKEGKIIRKMPEKLDN